MPQLGRCARWSTVARCTLVGLLLLIVPAAKVQLDLDAGVGDAAALAMAETLAARGGPAVAVPEAPQLWQRALALVPIVVEQGCTPYLLGDASNSFGESSTACDVFLVAALVSLALDDPARTTEATSAVDALIDHALSANGTAPFASTGWITIAGRQLPRSVLYQGFVLLALAGRERLGPNNARSGFYDALATSLAQRLVASSAGFLPTYGVDHVWPCDHTPALSALTLHAQLRPAAAHDTGPAARALRQRLAALLDAKRGFVTRIAPSGKVIEATPRGVAMAWSAGFLVAGDPALAARFAQKFSQTFCRRHLGLAACREWPPGVDNGPDASSGPIVLGFGIGASALGLAATRALPDANLHRELLRTAHLVGVERMLSQPEHYPLENAIYLWARSARPWAAAAASEERP